MSSQIITNFLVRDDYPSEELSKIGGIKSAIAVLEIGKPFFIAIGHSQDRNVSLLEKVCDYAYHTPSALGTQFGEALRTEIEKEEIKKALNEKEREKEREKEDLRQVLLNEKKKIERELDSLVQNLKNENEILKNKANKVYVYMIAGIVVGIAVGIALASIILKS